MHNIILRSLHTTPIKDKKGFPEIYFVIVVTSMHCKEFTLIVY
jgi:hypothetical protein